VRGIKAQGRNNPEFVVVVVALNFSMGLHDLFPGQVKLVVEVHLDASVSHKGLVPQQLGVKSNDYQGLQQVCFELSHVCDC
jgi:hypothetical protein